MEFTPRAKQILSTFCLEDRIAVITGGGAGIGKAIAVNFAGVGAHVVVAEIVPERAESAVAEIRALGRKSIGFTGDTTKSDQLKLLIEKTLKEFGRIDILVNNVGSTRGMRAHILEMPEEMWDATIHNNLKSTFIASKIIGKVMADQKKGNIVNLASASGLHPYPAQPAYGAAKVAVMHLTESLAILLAPYHIRVNAIAPTTTATPGITYLGNFDERAALKGVPLGRAGRVEDVAYAAIYLASDASDYVTGVTIPVIGGPYLGGVMLKEAEGDWEKAKAVAQGKKTA